MEKNMEPIGIMGIIYRVYIGSCSRSKEEVP